jgi:hypothetical protein
MMPRSDEIFDQRVRQSLEEIRTGPIDVAHATRVVRERAATRVRRRRAAGSLGVAAVIVVVVAAGVLQDDHRSQVDTVPRQTTETPPSIEYGFPPLTPLLDAPIPSTGVLEITKLGDRTLVVHSEPNKLSLILQDPLGAGSMSAEPMRMVALSSGGSSGGTFDPDSGFVYGVTRAEVAFAELTLGDRDPIRQATLAVDELPQLRFFLFDVGAERLDPEHGEPWSVAAFDADGGLLTDEKRIREEQEAFEQAMDDRSGVEVVRAGIAGWSSEREDTLVLQVYACGGEPMPTWTEAADRIEVSVTIKRPVGAGECTSGGSVESHLGLNSPLGGRQVVDASTGEPIPHRP